MIPFSKSTSTFSSTQKTNNFNIAKILFKVSEDHADYFWEEIWGVVKNIKIPYETVMSMPVYVRKMIIQKHNRDADEINNKANGGDNNGSSNMNLNAYARNEQLKEKNIK